MEIALNPHLSWLRGAQIAHNALLRLTRIHRYWFFRLHDLRSRLLEHWLPFFKGQNAANAQLAGRNGLVHSGCRFFVHRTNRSLHRLKLLNLLSGVSLWLHHGWLLVQVQGPLTFKRYQFSAIALLQHNWTAFKIKTAILARRNHWSLGGPLKWILQSLVWILGVFSATRALAAVEHFKILTENARCLINLSDVGLHHLSLCHFKRQVRLGRPKSLAHFSLVNRLGAFFP